MQQLYVTLVLTSFLVTSCRGYPGGVPAEVCSSMFPHHGVQPQNSPAPYSIAVDSTVYTPGSTQNPIRVTVMSDNTAFKGIFIQARSLTNCDQTVGTFQLDPSENDLKLITCRQANDAVSHKSANVRTTKTFTWIPPATGMGHVYIRATVVQSKAAFWNTVQSPIIYQGSNDASTSVTCIPPPTIQQAATLDGNGSHGDDSHENQDDDGHDDHDGHDHDNDAGNGGASVSFSHIMMTSLFFVALLV